MSVLRGEIFFFWLNIFASEATMPLCEISLRWHDRLNANGVAGRHGALVYPFRSRIGIVGLDVSYCC